MESIMSDINKDSVKSRRYSTAVDIAKCALFVVVMVVAAFVRIPIPYVPLTFQTVAAVLAGLLLGAKWGSVAVAVYVFMGLVGLPVFAGGAGGFSYILQLSFGYLFQALLQDRKALRFAVILLRLWRLWGLTIS